MRDIKTLLQLMLDNKFLFTNGLCYWAWEMKFVGLITVAEVSILSWYIRNNRVSKYSSLGTFYRSNRAYWWKPGNITPRIKWIKEHIKKNSNTNSKEITVTITKKHLK